jgi:hypothetical protein
VPSAGDDQRLRALVEAGERDLETVAAQRSLGGSLATRVGGELALRWRIIELRALLLAPPQDDTIAERYAELVEAAREHEPWLERVRELGEEIRARQRAGELPRSMIARAPRRPQRDKPA